MLTPTPSHRLHHGEGGAMCLRPVESNAGVRNHDRATQGDDRQTDKHTICALYDDCNAVGLIVLFLNKISFDYFKKKIF